MNAKNIVPAQAVDIDEAMRRFPTLRQSLLSKYDDCPLSTYFDLRYSRGWSTHPQARGTIFHRFAAEFLRTLQVQGHETMPRDEAAQILVDVCRQRDTPAEDIVRVPMRQMPELWMAADKFAKDNRFSIDRLVDIERRYSAELTYDGPAGQRIVRTLTGQIDAMLFDPPDGAIVIDWKDTWGLPPEPKDREPTGDEDDELKGLSYHGYFQQRFYGWLVMMNYPNVERVTLREFYARKTKVRKATLLRSQLPSVEDELRILAEAFDLAVMQGAPNLKADEEGYVDIDALGRWKPAPGKHCGFCVASARCPIEEDARLADTNTGTAVSTPEQAAKWAARLQVMDRVRDVAREACKGYVETSGRPIPVRWSKGRRVLGWMAVKGGRRKFGFFTPDESDRGAHPVVADLEAAMREATTRAKAERVKAPA